MVTRGSIRLALLVAVVGLFVVSPSSAYAQDAEETALKTEANLAPPEGATDTAPTGKAKTLYVDNGQKILQKLAITAQHLERQTDYRVLVDGVELGVFRPRGNSGTLVLRFRDPAKGNQTPIPEELLPVSEMQTVEVFDDESGELVLAGTLEVVGEDDSAGEDGDSGSGDDTGGEDGGASGEDGDSGGDSGGDGHGDDNGQGGNGNGQGGGNGNGQGGGNGHGGGHQ
jgi:hypothetical protein